MTENIPKSSGMSYGGGRSPPCLWDLDDSLNPHLPIHVIFPTTLLNDNPNIPAPITRRLRLLLVCKTKVKPIFKATIKISLRHSPTLYT